MLIPLWAKNGGFRQCTLLAKMLKATNNFTGEEAILKQYGNQLQNKLTQQSKP